MSKFFALALVALLVVSASSKDLSIKSMMESLTADGNLGQATAFGGVACLSGITGLLNSGFMLFDMFTYNEFVAQFNVWVLLFHAYNIVFNVFVTSACGMI